MILIVTVREGGDPEPEPGKDQREFASLFPEEVYYSSVSADRSGLLAVVPMALVSGLALVLGPHRSSR